MLLTLQHFATAHFASDDDTRQALAVLSVSAHRLSP